MTADTEANWLSKCGIFDEIVIVFVNLLNVECRFESVSCLDHVEFWDVSCNGLGDGDGWSSVVGSV